MHFLNNCVMTCILSSNKPHGVVFKGGGVGSSPEHFFQVQITNWEIIDTSSYEPVLLKQEK